MPAELRQELEGDGVILQPYADWAGFLGKLTPEAVGEALYVVPERTGLSFCLTVPEDIPVQTGLDMVESFKALKNKTEQQTLRRAMVRFLMGLEEMLAGLSGTSDLGAAARGIPLLLWPCLDHTECSLPLFLNGYVSSSDPGPITLPSCAWGCQGGSCGIS